MTFTAGYRSYSDPVLDRLDPEGDLISHRLFRDCCYVARTGRFVKNLKILGTESSCCVPFWTTL